MNVTYTVARALCQVIFKVYFRWHVCHPDRLPAQGPVILAANHASILDPPLIGAGVVRPINYLARESLFRWPLCGRLLRALNTVPVDRDGGTAKGLKTIIDRLMAGGAIILFPEGTRTLDGKLQPARSGVGLVAMKSNAPVLPVRVFGTFEAWNRQRRFPRPHKLIVKYGPLMRFDALYEEARGCPKWRQKEIYQQVSDAIMAAIARLEPGPDPI